MRLMEAGAGALEWVCLYCGAQARPEPRYPVRYCYCRSTDPDDGLPRGGLDIEL